MTFQGTKVDVGAMIHNHAKICSNIFFYFSRSYGPYLNILRSLKKEALVYGNNLKCAA